MTTVEAGPERATRPVGEWSWRSGPCAALGHEFELRVEVDNGVRKALEPILTPFRVRAPAAAAAPHVYEVRSDGVGRQESHTLFSGNERVASGRRANDLCQSFAWAINQGVLREATRTHVLLHAAAATVGGVTVIMPAEQESGKTTTVAGLLRAGFDYVTDEAVALDPHSGWVTPFPKTLSLDPGSWFLFPECRPEKTDVLQWQVPAARLGARSHRSPVVPPRLIVFPRYVAGATTRVLRLTGAEATRQLVQCCFDFQVDPRRNLRLLGKIAARATAVNLVIGSLDEAVGAIEGLVSEALLEDL